MAQLRCRQLPVNAVQLREQQTASTIPLPALGDAFDEQPVEAASPRERAKATELAKACVEQLEQDPNDVAAREKLARIFAERLQQADRGLEQLFLLLDMPEQPEVKKAEWLSLAAAWRIKYLQDFDTGRTLLQRLAHEFPQTPQALAARRRLQTLKGHERPASGETAEAVQDPATARDHHAEAEC